MNTPRDGSGVYPARISSGASSLGNSCRTAVSVIGCLVGGSIAHVELRLVFPTLAVRQQHQIAGAHVFYVGFQTSGSILGIRAHHAMTVGQLVRVAAVCLRGSRRSKPSGAFSRSGTVSNTVVGGFPPDVCSCICRSS